MGWLPWIAAVAVIVVAIALFAPKAFAARGAANLEEQLRAQIERLKRYKVERLAFVIGRTYLRNNETERLRSFIALLDDLYKNASSGQINVRKVGRLDNEVTILEGPLSLEDADELTRRLRDIVHDPDATKRRLRAPNLK